MTSVLDGIKNRYNDFIENFHHKYVEDGEQFELVI